MASNLLSLCIQTDTELGRTLHCQNFFTKTSDYLAPGHVEYAKRYQGASSRLALGEAEETQQQKDTEHRVSVGV